MPQTFYVPYFGSQVLLSSILGMQAKYDNMSLFGTSDM